MISTTFGRRWFSAESTMEQHETAITVAVTLNNHLALFGKAREKLKEQREAL